MLDPMLPVALNHMTVPKLDHLAFFELAKDLGCSGVELRNDLGRPLFEGAEPESVQRAAQERGLEILALAEVRAFTDMSTAKLNQAGALLEIAKRCGARAVTLIPRNDGQDTQDGARQRDLRRALIALRPALEDAGLIGLIEPLGFATSSVRDKAEVVETLHDIDATDRFQLVHDTFHHHLAGGGPVFGQYTGLVHISGCSKTGFDLSDLDRGLIGSTDTLENLAQIRELVATGYTGALSFEAFSPEIHAVTDPKSKLSRSIHFINSHLANRAA